MRQFTLWAIIGMVMLGPALGTHAAPWENLISGNKIDADPNKTYTLTQDNGPWMIMACTFTGPDSNGQARALVQELRERYHIEAFQYTKSLKLDTASGRGIDQYGAPMQMRYQGGKDEVSETAVLVGNYSSVDDPNAQSTLEKVKRMKPKALELREDNPTSRPLAGLRLMQQAIHRQFETDQRDRGPMAHALVTTNPLLPRESYVAHSLDPLIKKINTGIEYSLLDCPGRYTVQVATFRGKTIIDQGQIEKIEANSARMPSTLDQAALTAYELVTALRRKGYEAYVFHDRNASIVTIGSFNSVGTPRSDGRIELNPNIHKIMELFGMSKTAVIPGKGPAMKSLIGIPFDLQPMPVEVPRASLMSDHNQFQPSTGRVSSNQVGMPF